FGATKLIAERSRLESALWNTAPILVPAFTGGSCGPGKIVGLSLASAKLSWPSQSKLGSGEVVGPATELVFCAVADAQTSVEGKPITGANAFLLFQHARTFT